MAEAQCKACRISVRIPDTEVRRIISEYFSGQDIELASDAETARRLELCADCPDLQYGTTCRHCGCLVAVRARIASKGCPAAAPRW